MKQVIRWLGLLLVGCIVLRVSAQLIEPVIPLLIGLFITVLIVGLVFRRSP